MTDSAEAEAYTKWFREYDEPVYVFGVPDTDLDEEVLRRTLRWAAGEMKKVRQELHELGKLI